MNHAKRGKHQIYHAPRDIERRTSNEKITDKAPPKGGTTNTVLEK